MAAAPGDSTNASYAWICCWPVSTLRAVTVFACSTCSSSTGGKNNSHGYTEEWHAAGWTPAAGALTSHAQVLRGSVVLYLEIANLVAEEVMRHTPTHVPGCREHQPHALAICNKCCIHMVMFWPKDESASSICEIFAVGLYIGVANRDKHIC